MWFEPHKMQFHETKYNNMPWVQKVNERNGAAKGKWVIR